jgi:hypothetical protein
MYADDGDVVKASIPPSARSTWHAVATIWRGRLPVLLIWGWKTRLKTLGEGTFFSPAAGGDGPYRLVEARRWFTVFFIPLIPLKVLGTFVECQQTGATYDPSVLDNPTNEALLEQLAAAVRETIALVLAFGSPVTDAQREAAVRLAGEYAPGYSAADLEHDISVVAHAPIDQRLSHLADALDVSGKERLLNASASVMVAGGSVDDVRVEAVRGIGEKLGMTPLHIRGVIDSARSTAAS